jgi:hypothetical protein
MERYQVIEWRRAKVMELLSKGVRLTEQAKEGSLNT